MTQNLAEHVAGQMRAEMARQKVSTSELARRLDRNESWVRRRIHGQYEIALGDLQEIAAALELPVGFFIPAEVRS
jgi:transcriptional regulator with XRE-family HTH domain